MKWHPASKLPDRAASATTEIDDSLADVFDDPDDDDSLPRNLPLATVLHRQRGCAVICDCPIKGRYEWPAQLTMNGDFWVCAQSPSCGFSLPIRDTLTARRPIRSGGLIAETKPDSVEPPRKSWQIAADDCGLKSDEMDAVQVTDFKTFLDWWRNEANTRLTPQLFVEQWGVFAAG